MADIFISYKSNRKAAAKHLERIFELYGFSVWFDYSLMSGNDDFDIQILRELEAAKVVVVLWCSKSVESIYVKDEARNARERDTYVGVIIEKEIQMPLGFGGGHLTDLSDWNGGPRDPSFDALLRQIIMKTGKQPNIQYIGLADYDEIWQGMGSPALCEFTLLPNKSDPRPEKSKAARKGKSARASELASLQDDAETEAQIQENLESARKKAEVAASQKVESEVADEAHIVDIAPNDAQVHSEITMPNWIKPDAAPAIAEDIANPDWTEKTPAPKKKATKFDYVVVWLLGLAAIIAGGFELKRAHLFEPTTLEWLETHNQFVTGNSTHYLEFAGGVKVGLRKLMKDADDSYLSPDDEILNFTVPLSAINPKAAEDFRSKLDSRQLISARRTNSTNENEIAINLQTSKIGAPYVSVSAYRSKSAECNDAVVTRNCYFITELEVFAPIESEFPNVTKRTAKIKIPLADDSPITRLQDNPNFSVLEICGFDPATARLPAFVTASCEARVMAHIANNSEFQGFKYDLMRVANLKAEVSTEDAPLIGAILGYPEYIGEFRKVFENLDRGLSEVAYVSGEP